MDICRKNKLRIAHLKQITADIDKTEIAVDNNIKKNIEHIQFLKNIYIDCINNYKIISKNLL